jgi:hypothetical protein
MKRSANVGTKSRLVASLSAHERRVLSRDGARNENRPGPASMEAPNAWSRIFVTRSSSSATM